MPIPHDYHIFIDKSFDGERMVFHEKLINPKDYPTFEKYLNAIKAVQIFYIPIDKKSDTC